mmetsp:Transcript_34447/g.73377  ORF Transcript_34447/g.73377 Transcript_34447/m.73377 type:complete len:398 (-) Transcript_34447:415-1608(-)
MATATLKLVLGCALASQSFELGSAQEFLAATTTTTTPAALEAAVLVQPWVELPGPGAEPAIWPRLDLTDLIATQRPVARFPQGSAIRLFAVGSSNLMWETWLEQLHLLLLRLGYQLPLVDSKGLIHNRTKPASTADCSDKEVLDSLDTLRVAKPGWSSWGFVFNDQADCNAAGFRPFLGYNVSCTNAWQCDPSLVGSDPIIRPADVAEIARDVDILVLSTWMNDFTTRFPGNPCFEGGEFMFPDDITYTVTSLQILIRAVHAVNPEVVVVVMSKYPAATAKYFYHSYDEINAAVQLQLAGEPNTHFVNFDFPENVPMFLVTKSLHPNCRGDKLFAQSIVNKLFRAGILERGVAIAKAEECPIFTTCEAFTGRPDCCQARAECWVNEGVCSLYAEGEP